MTWTYSDEYYKSYTRDTWNESAEGYAPMLRNLDRYTPAMLRRAALKPGERVLDVATGPGEPALAAAAAVGPQGRVVGIDLAERMVDLARKAAKERRADHAEFHTMDAEKLTFPDASFDAVLCRFGLQIVTDPDQAAREARRVLRPGGRLVATVWTTGEANPAIHSIIGPMLEYAEPDETGYLPTPYEMGASGQLAEVLRKAGFRDATEEVERQEQTFPSLDGYLAAILRGTPIGHSLSEEDEDVQRDVMRKTRENAMRWARPDGSLAMPSEARVVVGLA
ncbi:MAG TPA: methyltransferase domain-containing protein [Candidatus Thermoplasmatota archaeon]|nr:methyltransferase domain-containing protein [Candidatus Thermoplasmatota archaeon]